MAEAGDAPAAATAKPKFSLMSVLEAAKAPPEIEEDGIITNARLEKIVDELGIIYTSFPENPKPEFEGRTHFPKSYYTLSPKEKLLLLFAENFRRQYKVRYPTRKPTLLAPRNECGVQKFVSTTIRPTAFLNPDLVGNWQAIAEFIADHIVYEALPNPLTIPDRLLSPETVLLRRKGSCFDMATLLCSYLIGSGFAACVVSGYASREFTKNDQQRVECPYLPNIVEEVPEKVEKEANKYSVKEPPDLTSYFQQEVEQRKLDKIREMERIIEEERLRHIEEMERPPPDIYLGTRIHAWVVMIENAPWCYRPDAVAARQEYARNEDLGKLMPTAFFIEPATGFRHETDNPAYMGIEVIWNQHNYYVNRQGPFASIPSLSWDLADTNEWEHLLPGEPYELRVDRPLDDEEDPETEAIDKEKHLDMPFSWVRQLNISMADYTERYPNSQKKIHYKKAVLEKFAPYLNENGLMKRLTFYDNIYYKTPISRWEVYANRADLLEVVKIDFQSYKIEEYLPKGRADALKTYFYYSVPYKERVFRFYHRVRFDSLKEVFFHPEFIQEHYQDRLDLLYFREFKYTEDISTGSITIKEIIEKYNRNPAIPADYDISVREFLLTQNVINIKCHYNNDAVTVTTRSFPKPERIDMLDELKFDPSTITGYTANPWDPQPTETELYQMFKVQLDAEEKSKKDFHERYKELIYLMRLRSEEQQKPQLRFSIFDPTKNEAGRRIRLERIEQKKLREIKAENLEADFLVAYWIHYSDRQPNESESFQIVKNCLVDLNNFFNGTIHNYEVHLKALQKEQETYKKFLKKYQKQIKDNEYEKYLQDGENIERNIRVVLQRILLLKDELQRKRETILKCVKTDKRLTISCPNEFVARIRRELGI